MLTDDPAERKHIPLARGCLDYFPSAIVAIAALSAKGNDQHNPGDVLHWDRAKSGDEADALLRHFLQRGTVDADGVLHSTKLAWRALALLQKELEAAGAPIAPGARNVPTLSADLPDSPIVAALIELHDEDAATAGLKAGEAFANRSESVSLPPHVVIGDKRVLLNPVSQETGD